MSTWTIILVAVFLNATDPPKVFHATLLPGTPCDVEIAHHVADHFMEGQPYTDLNYSCNDAIGPADPTAAPATPKKHIPGGREA